MEVSRPAVVITLSDDDAAVLGRQLVEAIRLGYITRGTPPPRMLLDLADSVNRAARGSGEDHPDTQATTLTGTSRFRSTTGPAGYDQPARVSVAEASRITGRSGGYLRRLARQREIEAVRGPRGWLLAADDLTAWTTRRSRARER